MTVATVVTGRVSSLKAVRGVVEYRFVPLRWTAPASYLTWYEFDPVNDAEQYVIWKRDIESRRERLLFALGIDWDYTVTWVKQNYTARVDFHEVERPVLVAIGGL